MPVRTNGGVFTDQVLSGLLKHFRIKGADFSGAVDENGTPVTGSAAEIIYIKLSARATISIMDPVTNNQGMSIALETGRAAWTAEDMQEAIRSLGTNVGVDNVDVSNVTVEQTSYDLIAQSNGGATTFLDLTDTPSSYAGFGGEAVAVTITEDGLEFIPLSGGGGGAVDSVFGRTGDVVALSSDYLAIQIDYDNSTSGLVAIEVQSAIDEVEGRLDTVEGSVGTALQPGDNVSELVNDAGYLTTALQSGDNVSELVNDAGYLTDITGESIDDLSDVDITGIISGQILEWDGSQFIAGNKNPTGGNVDSVFGRIGDVVAQEGDYIIDQMGDVDITGITNGQILEWDGVQFIAGDKTGVGGAVDSVFGRTGDVVAEEGDYSIDQMSDVDLLGILDNDILRWDSTSGLFLPVPDNDHLHIEADITDLDRIRWLGEWVQQEYVRNDQVVDDAWTMIANKTTTDRAAPQLQNEGWSLDENVVWPQTDNAQSVVSGNRATIGQNNFVELSAYRVWLPEDPSTVSYTMGLYQVVSQGPDVRVTIDQFDIPSSAETGWYERNISSNLYAEGTVLDFLLFATKLDPASYFGPYYYVRSTDILEDGECASDRDDFSFVYLHKTDGNSVPQDFSNLTEGTQIRIVETANASRYQLWSVDGTVVDSGTFWDIPTALLDNGDLVRTDKDVLVSILAPSGVPADYVYDDVDTIKPDEINVTLDGLLGTDFDDIVTDTNYYGTDAFGGTYISSDDWDEVAFSGGGSGNTGGAVSSVFGRTGDVVAEEGDYSVDQMSDVDTTGVSVGQILEWDGSQFIPGDKAGIVNSDLGDWIFEGVGTGTVTSQGAFRTDDDDQSQNLIDIRINELNAASEDKSTELINAQSGDYIEFTSITIPSNTVTYRLTETPIQATADEIIFSNLSFTGGADFTISGTFNFALIVDTGVTKIVPFYSHNGSVTQTITGQYATIFFETSVRTSANYSYNQGVVTVQESGWYKIDYDISSTSTNNARTTTEAAVEIDSVIEPGSFSYGYNRNNTDGENTATGNIQVELTSGQTVQIVVRGLSGNIETLPDACRLNIIFEG